MIKRVCENIYKEFSDIPVYTERVVQGLDEPCFFVYLKNCNLNLFRGKRYWMENRICIEYLGPQLTENTNICSIIERLCLALEKIDCDGQVLGSGIKSEISEGVLTVTVNYNMFVYKTEATESSELMEDMSLNWEV